MLCLYYLLSSEREKYIQKIVCSGLSQRQFRFVWFLLNLSKASISPQEKKKQPKNNKNPKPETMQNRSDTRLLNIFSPGGHFY